MSPLEIFGIFALFVLPVLVKSGAFDAFAEDRYCVNCGLRGKKERYQAGGGSILISATLWLAAILGLFFFILPGIFFLVCAVAYTAFHRKTVRYGCPHCGHANMVPLNSPAAQRPIAGSSSTPGSASVERTESPNDTSGCSGCIFILACVTAIITFAVWNDKDYLPGAVVLYALLIVGMVLNSARKKAASKRSARSLATGAIESVAPSTRNDTTAVSPIEQSIPTGDSTANSPKCRFCNYCGEAIPVDSTFCGSCGRKLMRPLQ